MNSSGILSDQSFRWSASYEEEILRLPTKAPSGPTSLLNFLERRDGSVFECLVSRRDFNRVRRHHWYTDTSGKGAFYAAAWIDGAQVHMHKYLCPNWVQVNHENGDGLDNRRENLRGVGGAEFV